MTHLSDSVDADERESLTRRLQSGDITDVGELRGAIFALGDVHHAASIPAIEKYLGHEDSFVRVNAVQALTIDFRLLRHRATCQEIMLEYSDEDEFDLVLAAVTGLGCILEGSNDLAAMRLLAGIVLDARRNVMIRGAAYSQIQAINGVPFRSRVHNIGNERALKNKVDWQLISALDVRVPDSGEMTHDPLEKLRRICMALPEVEERLSHDEPAWFVRGKITFVTYADHHHDDRLAFWCAAPEGAQEVLVGSEPERFFRPPYVGVRGWLGVYLDVPVDWDLIAELVRDAYRCVAPKRLASRVGPAGE
jgi:hypothetical protein